MADATTISATEKEEIKRGWLKQLFLSLDGGGVKGYCSLFLLKELMRKVAQLESQSTLNEQRGPSKPSDYFDYIVGTSYGGLIAIMLGRLQMSVDEAIVAFEKLQADVFVKPVGSTFSEMSHGDRKEASSRLEHALRACVGEESVKMADSKVPFFKTKTMVLSVEKGKEERLPYVFSSYDRRDFHYADWTCLSAGVPYSVSVEQAAAAACASPAYFNAITMNGKAFVDAVKIEINPTEVAIRELEIMFKERNEVLSFEAIVSIGSGLPRDCRPEKRSSSEGSTRAPPIYPDKVFSEISTITNMDILMTRRCKERKEPYYRFSLHRALQDWKLDDSEASLLDQHGVGKLLKRIKEAAYVMLQEEGIQEELDSLAEILVNSRKVRVLGSKIVPTLDLLVPAPMALHKKAKS